MNVLVVVAENPWCHKLCVYKLWWMTYTNLTLKYVNEVSRFPSDFTPDEDYCSSLHQSTGGDSDSLYSGSEHSQFNSLRLVKREAGFPNPRRALIGSNQLWRVNDSPYYREYSMCNHLVDQWQTFNSQPTFNRTNDKHAYIYVHSTTLKHGFRNYIINLRY